jgi:hypothetical protein
MRTKTSAVLVGALLAVLLLGASGCGGGGSSASETTTGASAVETDTTAAETETETEMETEEADTTATEETDTASADTTTAAEEDEDSSTDTTAVASAEDCRDLANLSTELSKAFGGTPDASSAEYGRFLQEFADRAPEDIRDDFRTLADAYAKIADALDGVDTSSGETPDPQKLSDLMAAVQAIDQAKLTAASANISTWVTQNCVPGASGG